MLIGRDFNESHTNDKFMILINEENKSEYVSGLNINDKGINFINVNELHNNLYNINNQPYMFYTSVVVPDDALVCNKLYTYNSTKLIINEFKHIKLHELWDDELFCKRVVIKYKGTLRYVRKKTNLICMIATLIDGDSLKYVNDQTIEMCYCAVIDDGNAIQYIKEQTTDLCYAAIKQNPYALQYIKNQTPDLCLFAVSRAGQLLQFIDNQTEEICLAAIDNYVNAFYDVKIKTDKIIKHAIAKAGSIILSIETPSIELILSAIKTAPYILSHDKFKKLINYQDWLKIMKINGLAIKYMVTPTFQLCYEAVKQNGFALGCIKDNKVYEELYSTGLEQVNKALTDLYILINKCKTQNINIVLLTEKNIYTNIKLIQFKELYMQLYNTVYFKMATTDYTILKPIFKKYKIKYNNHAHYNFCMTYNNLHDQHCLLIRAIIINDIYYLFKYLTGDPYILIQNPLDLTCTLYNDIHNIIIEFGEDLTKYLPVITTYEIQEFLLEKSS